MLLMSALFSLFFLGGWLAPFGLNSILFFLPQSFFFALKMSFVCIFFVLTRSTFPRYRYDQLLHIGWKILLPFTLSYFLFVLGVVYSFDLFKNNFFLEYSLETFIY